jgi:hypothetical protein
MKSVCSFSLHISTQFTNTANETDTHEATIQCDVNDRDAIIRIGRRRNQHVTFEEVRTERRNTRNYFSYPVGFGGLVLLLIVAISFHFIEPKSPAVNVTTGAGMASAFLLICASIWVDEKMKGQHHIFVVRKTYHPQVVPMRDV